MFATLFKLVHNCLETDFDFGPRDFCNFDSSSEEDFSSEEEQPESVVAVWWVHGWVS